MHLRAAESAVAAGMHLEDPRRRRPVPFLRRNRDIAFRADSETIRIAIAGADDLLVLAIWRNADHAFEGVDVIEIAGAVLLEAGDVVVSARRGRDVLVEDLVVVGLVVGIEIVQPGDVISAEHENVERAGQRGLRAGRFRRRRAESLADDETQRLEQAGGVPLPLQFRPVSARDR